MFVAPGIAAQAGLTCESGRQQVAKPDEGGRNGRDAPQAHLPQHHGPPNPYDATRKIPAESTPSKTGPSPACGRRWRSRMRAAAIGETPCTRSVSQKQ